MEHDVNTLEQEDNLENQNTNTDDLDNLNDNSEPNDDNLDDYSDSSDDKSQVGDDDDDDFDGSDDTDRLTKEQLDAMDDDAFTEYLNSGKLPEIEVEPKQPDTDKEKEKEKETPTDKKPVDDKQKQEPAKKEAKQPEVDEADYKAVHAAIFKPFKANGKEIVPKTVDDVISLMQMGANYTKKMQLMAPMKKAVESLNKASIGEEDLNFLIDVHNGDKGAIKKLLEKHKVDPIELDMEDTNYVPKNNIASDEDVEYSDALIDIQSSLPKIQEIITKQWDNQSRTELLKNPQLMRALHEEIEMGRFDDVQAQLEIEKTFGRYKGKSDIEAYIDLVSRLVAEQQSKANVGTKKANTQERKPTKPIPDKTKAAPVRTKQTNQGSTLTVKDLLSMPEEEFNKLSMRDLV